MSRAIVLCLALLGCNRPTWTSGTLEPDRGIDVESLKEAAHWWNAEAGHAWRVAGCGKEERCVPVWCGIKPDCDGDSAACVHWTVIPFGARPEIIVMCSDPRTAKDDVPLMFAHEIGHVAGYEHQSGTVMGTPLDQAAWEVP